MCLNYNEAKYIVACNFKFITYYYYGMFMPS